MTDDRKLSELESRISQLERVVAEIEVRGWDEARILLALTRQPGAAESLLPVSDECYRLTHRMS